MRELVSFSFLKGSSETVVKCKVVFKKASMTLRGQFFILCRSYVLELLGKARMFPRSASGAVSVGGALMDAKGPKNHRWHLENCNNL